nr:hypothetical protein [Klebsiella pneumoniae]
MFLPPAQVKQRQEEEKRRQQAWDAAHPEEGLKRDYDKAKAELDAEDKKYCDLKQPHCIDREGAPRCKGCCSGSR